MRTEAMNPQLIEAIIGCLLHDIGKPVQRAALGYPGRHSAIGRAFMKKVWLRDSRNPSQFTDEVDEADIGVSDRRILDAISYHHSSALRTAAENGRLAADAPAYIAYIADNIAAGTDRRKADSDDGHGASTWDPDTPLYSMFNRFGSGTANLAFAPEMLDDRKPINIPSPRRIEFDKDRYAAIVNKLKAILVDLERSDTYLASLLNVLEATLSFVPSSTDASEVVDVSLFDHLKLTGALGACIWHYLQATGQSDFKSALFDKQDTFYNEKAFLLTTFDVSGIQDFIYTIHSSGAAKMLRARSFYLEMLTEHLIDELLARVGLSRANLNYSGGGHAYLLLPNTESARKSVEQFEREANDWLLENFATRLFIATGSVPLAANDLMRRPNESASQASNRALRYSGLYRELSEQLSAKKLARYSADQLRELNSRDHDGQKGDRECSVCHTVNRTVSADDEPKCSLCQALTAASSQIQSESRRFLLISDGATKGLPLPFGATLTFCSRADADKALQQPQTRRRYAKNKFFAGECLGTGLWVGDYVAQMEFGDYVKRASGIARLGVLRLDVDNLGQAFTHGFMEQGNGKFNTISRTAAFSRMLSLFFRQHINYVLARPKLRPITGDDPARPREATIIYSGGDDVFVVGAWDDVIEFGIELRERFHEFTQGKLTVSAGIGMFPDKYPISVMAREVGDLEDAAKSLPGKNGVALFDREFTFGWDELLSKVIEEKYRHIADYFSGNEERGMAFIYKLLELLAERDDRITKARWVYFLTRMRNPTGDTAPFQQFANRLH
ncbi:CRISPR-associated protein cas10/csm1%2C subtype III-a/mtube [Mycobacterium tuberculosis]|nr:CRISPR-associated protein cas10/csm1%2C subtype III-a/mtube [Mycobacterium tuberculosis]CFJ07333.1 CRISPR-associated protein cas10/csm1%2C subtype III-a/mtube [Mycobacterium tuberculosis]CLM23222.1 CRISPR-associated protein cas10/csm1%2C subtype III-a/mtube [Mycobacterium tuberculosis]